MLYFQTLVTRSEDELTHKIYNAQKSNPVKGDWIQYLQEDFELIGEYTNEKLGNIKSRVQEFHQKKCKGESIPDFEEKTTNSHQGETNII